MNYSNTGVVVPVGALYEGACLPEDRQATTQEISAWEVARQPAPLEQIRAIERTPVVSDAMQRASRLVALAYAVDEVIRKAALKGLTVTREQAEAWAFANDPDYRTLHEAEQAIKPLRPLV